MLRKFDRLTFDETQLHRPAYIRDTGILVDEIVRLSMDRLSQAELLEKYPVLEAEDIYQCLAYSVDFSYSSMKMWNTEGKARIHSTEGYADILLLHKDSIDDKALGRLYQSLKDNSRLAITMWENLINEFDISYTTNRLQITSFTNIIEQVQDTFIAPYVYSSINPIYQISEHLSNIKCDNYLQQAIVDLLSNSGFFHYACSSNPILLVERQGDEILLQIIHTFPHVGISNETFTYCRTASLIIQQHGSKLEIERDEYSATASFRLPIVEDG